ncbi:MAG: recombinase zinc beta ribbon domain-containing protein, partial [Pseudomonadota bacterium]
MAWLGSDTEFHIKLRREFSERDARVECLNFKFEDSPEGRFIETIIAAQGQLEREQNSRQVVQKMKARLEKGYYVFHPPVGYRYATDKAHGKLLVRDEPIASIIAEALERYASGQLASQAEVKRFFESRPEFPRTAHNEVRLTKVREILERPTYAGYVEAPNWGVSLRRGNHEPLISVETHELVLKRLDSTAFAPARKDIREDFPMRGFIACDDCGEPMTSCWSKGRNKHYPYYICDTPGCPSKRRSIARDTIEDNAEAILRSLQPERPFVQLVREMFLDVWEMQLERSKGDAASYRSQIKEIEEQIESLLDRILSCESKTLLAAYEAKVEKLELEKQKT